MVFLTFIFIMNKCIALIARIDKGNKTHSGVWNKMLGITSGFVACDWDADLFVLNGQNLEINNNPIEGPIITKRNFLVKVLAQLTKQTYDVVWIRHSIYGLELKSFLRKVKEMYPGVKLYYEIPTFPYIEEFSGWKKIVVHLHKMIVMPVLRNYVDQIISVNRYPTLFNLPVLHFPNGIDTSLYQTLPKTDKTCQKLNLLAIGSLWDWFGLDRLIRGLMDYRGSYYIHLNIAGSGPCGKELSVLASKAEKHEQIKISFYKGCKIGQLAESTFENVIGVGTLASHRKNVLEIYSLKHREYAACGIPFVYAGIDPDFASKPWAFQLEASEDPIDIDKLVSWFESMELHSEEIRHFAVEKLDWRERVNQLLFDAGLMFS